MLQGGHLAVASSEGDAFELDVHVVLDGGERSAVDVSHAHFDCHYVRGCFMEQFYGDTDGHGVYMVCICVEYEDDVRKLGGRGRRRST